MRQACVTDFYWCSHNERINNLSGLDILFTGNLVYRYYNLILWYKFWNLKPLYFWFKWRNVAKNPCKKIIFLHKKDHFLIEKTYFLEYNACTLETVQDFLIKLGINPLMHLLEISVSDFQSHFSVSKIGQIFSKQIFCEEYLISRLTYINEIFWKYFIY